MTTPTIRDARPEDAPALAAIYRPYVLHSAASFEMEPPSDQAFADRIARHQSKHAFLTAEIDGSPVGYAYATPHRARHAYQWSVETSVYLGKQAQGQGLGKKLYGELFDRLEALNYCNAYAGIVLPNDASVGLHRALGFKHVGVFERVGFKMGAWQDVSWWHRIIKDGAPQGL